MDEGYVKFPGMTLTDTFQLHKADSTITEDFEGPAANNVRAKAEKDSAITRHRHERVDVAVNTQRRCAGVCARGLIWRGSTAKWNFARGSSF